MEKGSSVLFCVATWEPLGFLPKKYWIFLSKEKHCVIRLIILLMLIIIYKYSIFNSDLIRFPYI